MLSFFLEFQETKNKTLLLLLPSQGDGKNEAMCAWGGGIGLFVYVPEKKTSGGREERERALQSWYGTFVN